MWTRQMVLQLYYNRGFPIQGDSLGVAYLSDTGGFHYMRLSALSRGDSFRHLFRSDPTHLNIIELFTIHDVAGFAAHWILPYFGLLEIYEHSGLLYAASLCILKH